MSEIKITVQGPVGSGKSALLGEIEILCKALGVPVRYADPSDAASEKSMTHADWTAYLEMYKPSVVLHEKGPDRAALASAPVADERVAFKKCHSTIIKALAAIAMADGPDTRREDDPELIYRSPVMDDVVRIRIALDECSAALASAPVAGESNTPIGYCAVWGVPGSKMVVHRSRITYEQQARLAAKHWASLDSQGHMYVQAVYAAPQASTTAAQQNGCGSVSFKLSDGSTVSCDWSANEWELVIPANRHGRDVAFKELLQEIGRLRTTASGRYTSAMGEAAQAYLDSFPNAHKLPAQFRWADLWEAMTKEK